MAADEVQNLLCPLVPYTRDLDIVAADTAGKFWKSLVMEGPTNLLWAATGSGLASFWTSLGLVPSSNLQPALHSVPVSASDMGLSRAQPAWQMTRCILEQ